MPLSPEQSAAIAAVSLDEPWALIERFTTLTREHPDDVIADLAQALAG